MSIRSGRDWEKKGVISSQTLIFNVIEINYTVKFNGQAHFYLL